MPFPFSHSLLYLLKWSKIHELDKSIVLWNFEKKLGLKVCRSLLRPELQATKIFLSLDSDFVAEFICFIHFLNSDQNMFCKDNVVIDAILIICFPT